MRLTISSKANQKFIKDQAKALDMTEKEFVDYLITQTRLNGLQTPNIPQTIPAYDDSILERQTQNNYQETASEEFEIDPVIERFIALGITEEF